MNRLTLLIIAYLLPILIVTSIASPESPSRQATRGKVIFEQNGNCKECHLSSRGRIVIPQDNLTEEDLIRLLEAGYGPEGKMAHQPLPQCRLSRRDALAVAAYLKSISE
jgi:mono/diheme cytochrome c family protein